MYATAIEALKKVIELKPKTLLDIGSGNGYHAEIFREAGIEVTTLDSNVEADINAVWPKNLNKKYDCIWAAHVLEHSESPGLFIREMIQTCTPNGFLAITVPPIKPDLVGGHMTLWTPGLLVYNLIKCGIDCSSASVLSYGYNISVIVENKPISDFPMSLIRDNGELEQLKDYFPWPNVKQNLNTFPNINWNKKKTVVLWPYRFSDMKESWKEKYIWMVNALINFGYNVKRHPTLVCEGLNNLELYDSSIDNPADICIYNHATSADLIGNVLKTNENWFWKPSGPTSNHATLDTMGYGPYSSCGYEKPPYENVSDIDVNEFLNSDVKSWIKSRTSKWDNALSQEESGPGSLNDYTLILGQCAGDSVNTVMDFGNYVDKLLAITNECNRISSRDILIKLHPYMDGEDHSHQEFVNSVETKLLGISSKVHVVKGMCNVHPYIENCREVILANSGAGLEAMMHGKPIISWGKPEYHWVTYDLRHLCDLGNALKLNWYNETLQYKWLYWYCKQHCIYDQVSAINRVEELMRQSPQNQNKLQTIHN